MPKIAPKTGNCAETATVIVQSATSFAESGTVCGVLEPILLELVQDPMINMFFF